MLRPNRSVRVLCLSGGGFRGYYTASVLARMQKDLRIDNFANHFDLIIGTSTGALIAAALSIGKRADEVEKQFAEFGPRIFPRNQIFEPVGTILHQANKVWRALRLRHQYHRHALEKVARTMLGDFADKTIGSLPIPLATVAVSKVTRTHHVFGGMQFARPRDREIKLIDAVLASTAAPYYFKAYTINDLGDPALTSDVLMDGGLVANAPVLLGAIMARTVFSVPLSEICVLHLDTAGVLERGQINSRGWRSIWPFRAASWGLDLVELTMSAQESMQTNLAREILGERYVYLEARSANAAGQARAFALDDASQAARQELRALARDTWDQWHKDPRLGMFFPPKPPVFPDLPPSGQQGNGPHLTLTSAGR